ncbi:alcohol dehydrogenase catalytic domain-containing protein [Streptomyces sp. M10(2022)]
MQAPVWGLVRSAQSEHPGRIVLVDVDGDVVPDWSAVLGADEPQLAVRSGELLAPRLARTEAAAVDGAWRLGSKRKGSLEDLAIIPSTGDRPLGVNEVRVGIRAAGLNFRDVLIALGTYPGEAPLGSEAAGVVLEVGAEVTDLVPGERVFGLVVDAFGPVAIADRRTIVRMPESFSFTEAAALPVVYLTAYYGLVDLAALKPGERLLVHAPPVAWAWLRCSWRGTSVRRSWPRRASRSGTRCVVSVFPTTGSPPPGPVLPGEVPPGHGRCRCRCGAERAGR